MKEIGDFPSHLEYVDSYFDSELGSNACAFVNTMTGETIVGFSGTNWDNGTDEAMKNIGGLYE